MANQYKQITNFATETHFAASVSGELVMSRMTATPTHLTTFNAGDIVPVYYAEVLPHDTFSVDVDFVIRQTTLLTPTMGSMLADIHAFFVPNRIVNQSWKTVNGENPNGSWTVAQVSTAPLFDASKHPSSISSVQIPVGSIADYYGFPTQLPIPASVLSLCNDWKFRGYVEIYNEFYRDQNYQPPIPYSKLNVYENFLQQPSGSSGTFLASLTPSTAQDNSYGAGAVAQAVYGNLSGASSPQFFVSVNSFFDVKQSPLKANKLHDMFTSVLPSPQKGPSVFVPVSFPSSVPVLASPTLYNAPNGSYAPVRYVGVNQNLSPSVKFGVSIGGSSSGSVNGPSGVSYPFLTNVELTGGQDAQFSPVNLYADFSEDNASLSVGDLRMASAVQQVYEQLARGGSRYREFIRSFFGLDVDDPFKDIPEYLGHIRRDLQLYQTAQTAPSESGSTPQGNLAAFGYTTSRGHLFDKTFLEHGYIHILCVVRHKNIYSSYFAPDNFRLSMLDYYLPELANIPEQPVFTRTINPFYSNPAQVFGYQEPWYEYRFEPDRVSGLMRPGASSNLAIWNYADDFSSSLAIADAEFMKSNSQKVLDRTLAATSESGQPQFKGQFTFVVNKTRPMPTYSVPGMDII